MSEPTRVLLVEDDPGDAYILRWHLKSDSGGHHFELDHVEFLATGLERLAERDFEILLLDLGLPDSLGLETFSRFHQEAPDVPIVVLSGIEDEEVALAAVREGAQDYLVKKDLTRALLTRAICYALERHAMQESIRSMSLTDSLTGLYNRRGFETLAQQQFKQVRRSKKKLTLVYLDLDDLKKINDNGGHRAGDEAIVEAAELLRRSFRDSDIVARLGGDEFAVLLVDARDGATEVPLQRLSENLAMANGRSDRPFPLSLSLGRADWDPETANGTDLAALIQRADEAMYRQKHSRQKRQRSEAT